MKHVVVHGLAERLVLAGWAVWAVWAGCPGWARWAGWVSLAVARLAGLAALSRLAALATQRCASSGSASLATNLARWAGLMDIVIAQCFLGRPDKFDWLG